MYNNNQNMIDNLLRQKDRIEDMIKNYQQPQPVNNFINTGQQINENLYEIKVLNDGDEVENILVNKNTIFLGLDRLQIKKIDGTIEKYNIQKTFPIDPKDEKINQLEDEILKLKEMINSEHAKFNEPVEQINKSVSVDDVDVKSKPKKSSKSIQK